MTGWTGHQKKILNVNLSFAVCLFNAFKAQIPVEWVSLEYFRCFDVTAQFEPFFSQNSWQQLLSFFFPIRVNVGS